MPIKFRCPHCRQFLGISRSKAGQIADCPMCGKTLRVPHLDGTVAPLPKPKLDLDDSALVDALGELASIGSTGDSAAATGLELNPSTANRPTRTTPPSSRDRPAAAPPALTPAPRGAQPPITLEPLEPSSPVVVTAQVAPDGDPLLEPVLVKRPPAGRRKGAGSRSSAGAPSTAPAMSGKPSSLPSGVFLTEPEPPMPPPSRVWIPIAITVALFLIGAVGLLTNINSSQPSVEAATLPPGEQGHGGGNDGLPPAVIPSNAANAPVPALTGRITYVTEAGERRPDDGARVVALPAERQGTVMLDTAGLQVGSSEVDTRIAAASIRALGGDLATTDPQGNYALKLPSSGSYKLLVISRHQSRSWEVGVESHVQELLAHYFLRPSTLLGQLAYEVQDVQYRGTGTSPRDITFARPE